jgi:hypothetical protein
MISNERDKVERIKAAAERKIWVTFRKEGIHRYPAAATDPALATGDHYDVSFLGYPHRHIFHFRVWIDVWHNDRDVEFIQFKRWLEALYHSEMRLICITLRVMLGNSITNFHKAKSAKNMWDEDTRRFAGRF